MSAWIEPRLQNPPKQGMASYLFRQDAIPCLLEDLRSLPDCGIVVIRRVWFRREWNGLAENHAGAAFGAALSGQVPGGNNVAQAVKFLGGIFYE